MHTLSTLSIDRAVTRLGRATKKEFVTQISHNNYAQILDDNGDILDYDTKAPNLVRRLNARMTEDEINELLGVS